MDIVREFLTGKRNAVDFMQEYMISDELHEFIQSLIPAEAIENPNHEYWRKCILRSGLECYNFDVRRMLYSHCGLGETDEDQRKIFDTIRAIYLWVNPKQKCTNIYHDRIDFYLDLEGNCFGGPEVAHLIRSVANEHLSIKPKSARKKAAKAKVDELFHVTGQLKPRWIQGPEWPMGSVSPMVFVAQKKGSNCVDYEFRDVDTGSIRVIKQYY